MNSGLWEGLSNMRQRPMHLYNQGLLWSSLYLTSVRPLHLLSQHLVQPGAVDFGKNFTLCRNKKSSWNTFCWRGFLTWAADSLRPWGWRWGEGNTQTGGRRRFRVGWNWEPDGDDSARPSCGTNHTQRQGGSLELSECSAATTDRTSSLSLWWDVTHRDTGPTWKGFLLKYAQVQQGAYCVRSSRRQEELDNLFAVFGHKIFTLLCVATGYEVTDLLHELHQSFLQGDDGKALMRNCLSVCLFILTTLVTSVILVGNRVSSFLMIKRQKEQVGSSSSCGEEPMVIVPSLMRTLYFCPI